MFFQRCTEFQKQDDENVRLISMIHFDGPEDNLLKVETLTVKNIFFCSKQEMYHKNVSNMFITDGGFLTSD